MYHQLKFDLYFGDIASVILCTSKIDEADKFKDRERKKKAMGRHKSQDKMFHLLCEDGLELCSLLLMFLPIPMELLQISSYLLVGLTNTLTENCDLSYHMQNKKPNRLFSFLLRVAQVRARLKPELIKWCVGYILIALQDLVASNSFLVSNPNLSTTPSSNPNLTAGLVTSLDWLHRDKRFGSNAVADDGNITEKYSIEHILSLVPSLLSLWVDSNPVATALSIDNNPSTSASTYIHSNFNTTTNSTASTDCNVGYHNTNGLPDANWIEAIASIWLATFRASLRKAIRSISAQLCVSELKRQFMANMPLSVCTYGDLISEIFMLQHIHYSYVKPATRTTQSLQCCPYIVEPIGIVEKEDKEKDSAISSGLLNLVAPELIFGDEPSIHSTMYVCGVIVTQILTGKQLIKVNHPSRAAPRNEDVTTFLNVDKVTGSGVGGSISLEDRLELVSNRISNSGTSNGTNLGNRGNGNGDYGEIVFLVEIRSGPPAMVVGVEAEAEAEAEIEAVIAIAIIAITTIGINISAIHHTSPLHR
eukprot:gene31239-40606_t